MQPEQIHQMVLESETALRTKPQVLLVILLFLFEL